MLLELTTKINKTIMVYVRMSDTTERGSIPEPKEINAIINKEFNFDFDFETNANRILSELQPYCLEVGITPILKGLPYSYTIIKRK